MAVEVACVMEAPSPIRTRAPMSVTMSLAAMHRTAETRNIVKPTMYSLLRPTMSESRPIGSRRELIVRA